MATRWHCCPADGKEGAGPAFPGAELRWALRAFSPGPRGGHSASCELIPGAHSMCRMGSPMRGPPPSLPARRPVQGPLPSWRVLVLRRLSRCEPQQGSWALLPKPSLPRGRVGPGSQGRGVGRSEPPLAGPCLSILSASFSFAVGSERIPRARCLEGAKCMHFQFN